MPEDLHPTIKFARDKKGKALELREHQPEAALELLREAEALLRRDISDLESVRGAEPPGTVERALAIQLDYILGTAGGIHRRHGAHAESIAQYDAGYVFEKKYQLLDSYTLVQRLVARVLANPDLLVDPTPQVDGVSVRDAVSRAETIVNEQINVGGRKNDEYASADLSLLRLLLNQEDWKEGFEMLRDKGSVYAKKVTRETIDQIAQAARSSKLTILKRDLAIALRTLPKIKEVG